MKSPRNKASNGAQRADNCSIPHLPIGVVMEILCRLPIKTLMAAKSVCKSWRHLISGDTHFAKSHLSRSPTELLRSASENSSPRALHLGNIHLHNSSVVSSMSGPLFHFPNLSGTTKITPWHSASYKTELFYVNTCNGLACFSNDFRASRNYAMICNPVTGEFITVSGPEKEEKWVVCMGYALGFSGNADRYKVLRQLLREYICPVTGEKVCGQFLEVCTIEKGSSWRNLGECPYLIGEMECQDFVFLEGKLHFLVKESHIIACFDFDSEQIQQIPPPPTDIDIVNGRWKGCLGVLDGCFYINNYLSCGSFDLWVMKEYGVEDSWTKAFTHRSSWGMYRPLKYLDNDHILMMFEGDDILVSYNLVTLSDEPVVSDEGLYMSYRPSLLLLKDALMGYNAPVFNARPRRMRVRGKGSSSRK